MLIRNFLSFFGLATFFQFKTETVFSKLKNPSQFQKIQILPLRAFFGAQILGLTKTTLNVLSNKKIETEEIKNTGTIVNEKSPLDLLYIHSFQKSLPKKTQEKGNIFNQLRT